jgi:radical SAM superfamily enzyme YgiQ (UPF0313 family)
VGIVTINAQYAHTHPGIRILRNIAHDAGLTDAWICEFTTSDPVWKMAEVIAQKKPVLLGISISIWNKESSLALARRVKAVLPNTRIIAGGPEVWFEPGTLEGIDAVLPGDAECAWFETLQREFNLTNAAFTECVEPYRECDFPHVKGRMVYLETSRGCPFQCAFCMSGRKDARYKTWTPSDANHMAQTVATLTQAGAHTIKFLDRTFNAEPARALAYFQSLAHVENAVCHFEICAELLDEETMRFLSTIPPGKFQFEVGIQSLNAPTLKAIGRRADTALLLEKLRALLQLKTVHVHADLIWGLPLESMATLKDSFNTLHNFGFDELQLGFLKFLRGAPISQDKQKYGYKVEPTSPYEALAHELLSGAEFMKLKAIEYVFNRFHNTKRFQYTIPYLLKSESLTPFQFYEKLAETFSEKQIFIPALTVEKQCEILLSIFSKNELLLDHLRLDYTVSQKVFTLPRILAIPNAKAPIARQTKEKHIMCVVFEHAFDPQKMAFSQERKTTAYQVTHAEKSGYYSRVAVEKISSSGEGKSS